MAIRLAITDDKQINRHTVKDKLASYTEVSLMMEARNAKDFLSQLKTARQLPDVVLMDLEMPEMNGIETILVCNGCLPYHQVHCAYYF